jgi:hypothetical protein
MSCKWLHDWGCDDKSWRFCSKGDISDHKGKGGCSKIKPVKEGNFIKFYMLYYEYAVLPLIL